MKLKKIILDLILATLSWLKLTYLLPTNLG
jgi:hypothetical protein